MKNLNPQICRELTTEVGHCGRNRVWLELVREVWDEVNKLNKGVYIYE